MNHEKKSESKAVEEDMKKNESKAVAEDLNKSESKAVAEDLCDCHGQSILECKELSMKNASETQEKTDHPRLPIASYSKFYVRRKKKVKYSASFSSHVEKKVEEKNSHVEGKDEEHKGEQN